APDLQLPSVDGLSKDGGAVCYLSAYFGPLDCVGWGNINFPSGAPSPIGTPEAAIPTDMMLERSIAANCPTLFDTADDTNNSDADFSPTAPPASGALRNNAAAVQETPCGGGGGGGGGDGGTPPGTPPAPVNPAGNVRKRKCKKSNRSMSGAQAAKKKCKKKR